MKTLVAEPGQRFGRLVVTDPDVRVYIRSSPYAQRVAVCRCDCGAEATVPIYRLFNGHTQSCGCLLRERAAELGRSPENVEHLRELARSAENRAQLSARSRSPENVERLRRLGRSPENRARLGMARRTHGLSTHPLYGTHRNMMSRCHNPEAKDYGRYGALGVTVTPDWHDVAVFIAWIEANLGPRPDGMTLDRIDGAKGYQPGNVQWSTPKGQAQNRRPPRPKGGMAS